MGVFVFVRKRVVGESIERLLLSTGQCLIDTLPGVDSLLCSTAVRSTVCHLIIDFISHPKGNQGVFSSVLFFLISPP